MLNAFFHILAWDSSWPSNCVQLVAVHKPGTVEVPASAVCKNCSEIKQAGLSEVLFSSCIT